MPDVAADPQHWRNRAAEMRGLAEETFDEELRAMLLEVAAGYDRLAERAQERLREG